jgi:hypothetical protein
MAPKVKNLAYHLASVPDPRSIRGKRHLLLDILVIVVLATICGADDWDAVEAFAKGQEAWLKSFLSLPNGLPSHDTYNRVFQRLDPQAFGEAFQSWVHVIREKIPGDIVALDGKTLRSAIAEGKPAVHMVSAWSEANQMVLAQRAVDETRKAMRSRPSPSS